MIDVLIVGLIIVALMVYASTKIKRLSAEAFEPERIETDTFIFEKSEEFLNKVEPAAGLALEGYSREFGTGDAANIRQATYEVKRLQTTLNTAVASLTASNTKTSDVAEVIDDKKYRLIAVRREDAGVGFIDTYKIAEADGRIVQLRLAMIDEASDEVRRRVETMAARFLVK